MGHFSEKDDPYLSIIQLATYSSLSRRRLMAYLVDRDHPLPHYRFGRRIAVRRSEFDAWAKQFQTRAKTTDEIDARINARLARR